MLASVNYQQTETVPEEDGNVLIFGRKLKFDLDDGTKLKVRG